MTATCPCGSPAKAYDYCATCWEKIPSELRAEWLHLYRTKRGSPSYWSQTREVRRVVEANAEAAKKAQAVPT